MTIFRPKRKSRKPRVPNRIRIYAIGDIHGRADLLNGVFERIDASKTANPTPYSIEVFLGDYIDRGPASCDVLDRLLARSRTHRAIFLKGNHESLMQEFLMNPSSLQGWQRLGGLDTLMSYGVRPPLNADAGTQAMLASALAQALPQAHRQFVDSLKTSFTCGDFYFVHAGVRPGIPLAKQREEDLLWIRQDFLLCEEDFGKVIVHGHTPVSDPEFRSNRINIDTGAFATGRLTCLMLEDDMIELI